MNTTRLLTTLLLIVFAPKHSIAQISLRPIADTSFVEFSHTGLPEQTFRLRIPEYVNVYTAKHAKNVAWITQGDGNWMFRWDAPDTEKKSEQTHFWGYVSPGGDFIDLRVRILNPSDKGWSSVRYWMFDITSGKAPKFYDTTGVRTFIVRDGKFVTINEAEGGKLTNELTGSFSLNPPPKHADRRFGERVMAKVSDDGHWILAIASDLGDGISYNLQPHTSCIHQNITWGKLRAGEEKGIRCRAYLFKGTLDDLLKRYVADFGRASAVKSAEVSAATGVTTVQVGLKSQTKEGKVERMPSVWEPATSLTTLEKLHELRPEQLPNHPMAVWMADLIIRNVKKGGGDEAVQRELAKLSSLLHGFRQENGFWIREDSSGVCVSNGRVGLCFAPPNSGLGLSSLYDMAQGIECISEALVSSSPFRITLQHYPRDGSPPGAVAFFPRPRGPSPNKLVTLTAAQAQRRRAVVSTDAGRLTVSLQFDGFSVAGSNHTFDVRVDCRLTRDDGRAAWRISVGPAPPNAGLVQVSCPVLRRLGYVGENDFLWTWGSGTGQLVRAVRSHRGGIYPTSQWGMQFLALTFGPRSTLYLACHDSDAHTKAFGFHPGQEFSFSAFAPNTALPGNSFDQPYDVMVGPVEGDWFDAAHIYREWAIQQPWCASGPLSERKDVFHKMLRVAHWIRPDWLAYPPRSRGLKQVERNVKELGGDVLQGIHWYGWNRERFDDDAPHFTPRPEAAPAFRKEAKDGFVVLPYTQICLWDKSRPEFDDSCRASACRLLDGSLNSESWPLAPMVWMCPSTALYRDTLSKVVADVAACGANAAYLDVFVNQVRDCYNTSHGHPLGIGGNWHAQANLAALRRIRVERGPGAYGLESEFFVEPYIGMLDTQLCWWYAQQEEAPLIPAVYSGYAVQSGSRTEAADDVISMRLKTGRRFLWGCQLGHIMFSNQFDEPGKAIFFRQLARLRNRMTRFFSYGKMLRPPRWASEIPQVTTSNWLVLKAPRPSKRFDAIHSALWRSPQGELALFLLNVDEHAHEISFYWNDIPGQFRPDSQSTGHITTEADTRSFSESASVQIEDKLVRAKLQPAEVMALVWTGSDPQGAKQVIKEQSK